MIDRIKDIIEEHVRKPNTVILAVIPGVEFETSVALGIAKKFDPTFSRTLWIINKLDLKDTHFNIIEHINNSKFKPGLGWVGVRTRVEKRGGSNLTIDERIRDEERWFRKHTYYKSQWGVSFGRSVLKENLIHYS